MDLTFQVPMQYCSLQHQNLLVESACISIYHQSHPPVNLHQHLSPVTSTTGCCFCFGSVSSFFLEFISPLISSSILGTYRPGEFLFQCPIIFPFHTVHVVLKARTLKWFVTPFSSGPHSVRPPHHDPTVLGGPTEHGLVSSS